MYLYIQATNNNKTEEAREEIWERINQVDCRNSFRGKMRQKKTQYNFSESISEHNQLK